MKFTALASIFLSTTLVYAHHPVMIMILIISQTLLVCLMLWIKLPTAWFSFTLFLIFVGGLMVLFIYITSLAANEMFNMSTPTSTAQMISISLIIAIMLLTTFFIKPPSLLETQLHKQLSSLFNNFTSPLTTIIMSYLLVTLVVVVKISTKMKGPIRSLINQK